MTHRPLIRTAAAAVVAMISAATAETVTPLQPVPPPAAARGGLAPAERQEPLREPGPIANPAQHAPPPGRPEPQGERLQFEIQHATQDYQRAEKVQSPMEKKAKQLRQGCPPLCQ